MTSEQAEEEIAARVMPTDQGVRDSENYEALTDWQDRLLRTSIISPDEARTRVFDGNQRYVMTGDGPMRITDQWGSIRAGYIEPSEPIGDSSNGIEPCGYEEL